MSKLIRSSWIYWCDSNDRYILVIRDRGEIVGLNYMQGDDYPGFLESYNYTDVELTKFYNSIKDYLSGSTELDRINQAIWAHFNYKNNY